MRPGFLRPVSVANAENRQPLRPAYGRQNSSVMTNSVISQYSASLELDACRLLRQMSRMGGSRRPKLWDARRLLRHLKSLSACIAGKLCRSGTVSGCNQAPNASEVNLATSGIIHLKIMRSICLR